MAVARTKKIQVAGRLHHRVAVLRRLQELGFVEIETGKVLSPAEAIERWHPTGDPKEQAALESEMAEITAALAVMDRFHPVRPTFIQQFSGIKTMMTPAEYRNHLAREEEAWAVIQRCRQLGETWAENEARLGRVAGRVQELTPWAGLAIPLSAIQKRGPLFLRLVKLPRRYREDFLKSIGELEKPGAYCEEVSALGSFSFLFLIHREEQDEKLRELLAACEAQVVEAGGEDRTPGEALAELHQEEAELRQNQAGLEQEIGVLVKKRPMLQVLYDEKANRLRRLEVAGELLCSEETFYLEGWITGKNLPRLHSALRDISPTIYLEAVDPEPGEDVPVELENHPLIRPFEVVVEVFGNPRYGEFDPTPAVAPFFIVFFGLALADLGYGLVLAALCWYLLRTVKMAGMAKKLFTLLFMSGLSSAFFGFLTAGVFGDLIDFPALWFNPTLEPNRLLVISLTLGGIQLYLGVILKAAARIKAGQYWDAIIEEGLWLFFLTSLALIAINKPLGLSAYAGFFPKLALAGGIAIMLSKARGEGPWWKRLLRIPGGLFNLYDAVSFFSDLLSYSRLMALGLSGAIIGQVINFFVRMFNPSFRNPIGLIAGLLVFCGGHLLNLLLSVLSSYVHNCRLQYIEFFGKFYDAGGRPIRPFAKQYRYIELEEKGEL
jgi:V/A-type H+-transporting ATPase subunit I